MRISRATRRSSGRFGLISLALVGPLSGCGSLLDVDLPGSVEAATLDNPALMPVVVAGAVSAFECAFSAYAAATGLISDELIQSVSVVQFIPWEHRQLSPNTGDLASAGCDIASGYGIYTPLQTARFAAADAVRRLEGFSDAQVTGRALLTATAAAYAGYSLIALGEGFCEMAVDGGPLLTRAQVFSLAEEQFTKAIQQAQSAGNADILNLGLVGRARTRLNLGRKADAATDAAQVPLNYAKNISRGVESSRRFNRVAEHNQSGVVSVHPRFRTMTFGSVADPRVRVDFAGVKGADGIHNLYRALKYVIPGNTAGSRSTLIRLASWQEAQLIQAEAAGGQTAVQIINVLHTRATLPPFSSNDPAEIMQQIIDERSREFFLEGVRLGDMLRYNLPFDTGPPAENEGIPYGTSTCMPLPAVERQGNSKIGG